MLSKYKLNQLYFKDTQFANLMTRRIFNVLLIANPYDAFMLEDDGRIDEKIFISLSFAFYNVSVYLPERIIWQRHHFLVYVISYFRYHIPSRIISVPLTALSRLLPPVCGRHTLIYDICNQAILQGNLREADNITLFLSSLRQL